MPTIPPGRRISWALGLVSPELTTYRWGREALEYTLRSDVWLEVFERKPPPS